jgi:hypothetical protein
MKKLITTIGILILSVSAFSQVCTPDNNITQPGYYPDQLDPAPILKPYEAVIQIRTITDTTVDYQGNPVSAKIDSVKVKDVKGLPPTFSYACYHPRCVFVGTETRCAKLTGNPQIGHEGIYPLKLIVTAYMTIGGFLKYDQTDTMTDFSIEVYDDGTNIFNYKIEDNVTIYPNPVRGELNINTGKRQFLSMKIKSTDGKVLVYSGFKEKSDLSFLPNGMYFLELEDKNGIKYYQKIVLEN